MKTTAWFKKKKAVSKTSKAASGRKLKATARSAPRRSVEEYEDEPTMKLGTAVIVVLVLHVVAVGGVYAFNTIKAERVERQEREAEFAPAPVSTASALDRVGTEALSVPGGRVHQVEAGETLAAIARTYGVTVSELEAANGLRDVALLRVGQEIRIPESSAPQPAAKAETRVASVPKTQATPKPAPAAPEAGAATGGAKDSGEIYTVVAGDNPVAIARKFKVSYNDLMQLNGIDDPRRLQIGQKLKIPVRR